MIMDEVDRPSDEHLSNNVGKSNSELPDTNVKILEEKSNTDTKSNGDIKSSFNVQPQVSEGQRGIKLDEINNRHNDHQLEAKPKIPSIDDFSIDHADKESFYIEVNSSNCDEQECDSGFQQFQINIDREEKDIRINNDDEPNEENGVKLDYVIDSFEVDIDNKTSYNEVVVHEDDNYVYVDEKNEFVDSPFSSNKNSNMSETCQTETTESFNTDGAFNSLFQKPKSAIQKNYEVRTNREGIKSSRLLLYPKEIEKRVDRFSVNSDKFYDMRTFPRGRLTIINVKYFTRKSGMADYPREGTDRDADGLQALFLDLGFIVERLDNPTRDEILNAMKIASSESYSGLSCCACAILTHGEEGIVYGSDSQIKIREITRMFTRSNLKGIPKIFFIQACQGSEYMDSVDGPGIRAKRSEEGGDVNLTFPKEADFLYAYSTVPGYYSWRNSRKGSWFIEALVKVFRDNVHKMDLMRMLMRVNDIVAFRKSNTDDTITDNKRQISSIVTQMRKELFFFPPYGPLSSKFAITTVS